MGPTIEGLRLVERKVIGGPKGRVLHVMRSDESIFSNFGEVYISTTLPGEVKGWKFHKKMQQNFVVPVGKIKFNFFDDREGSSTKGQTNTLEIGESNYALIQVPQQVWYSFKATSDKEAHIVNCASIIHDPDEVVNLPINDPRFPQVWT